MNEILVTVSAMGLFFAPLLLAGWVLRPLDRSARYHQSKGRFMMADFFGLVFLVQLPIALVANLYPGGDRTEIAPIFIFLPIVSGLVWWTAVTTFAKAGVKDIRTRVILVFSVLPIAYVGSISIIAVGVVLMSRQRPQFHLLAIAIILLVAMIASGLYTRSIERRLQLQPPAR